MGVGLAIAWSVRVDNVEAESGAEIVSNGGGCEKSVVGDRVASRFAAG